MDIPARLNVLSLCSGVGGLDLGIRLANPHARTVCWVEWDKYCQQVLRCRMRDKCLDDAPIWDDLRQFDPEPWRGAVDCVAGGFPCQPFSTAGERRGAADPRHLWPEFVRIIGVLRPPIVFCENVVGLLSLGLETVLDDLQKMDYAVACSVFGTDEVGGPHHRRRVFVLAHRNGSRRGDRVGNWGSLADVGGSHHAGGRRDAEVRDDPQCGVQVVLPKFAWPPGPEQLDLWADVDWQHKPTLPRMADGVAVELDRHKRHRCCGNGVVPLVAGYAWRVLSDALAVGGVQGEDMNTADKNSAA